MAKSGGGQRGGRSGGRAAGGRGGRRTGATARRQPAQPPARKQATAREPEPPAPVGPFRLGAIPGATPGKWIDVWQERMPRTELELVPLEVGAQRAALLDGEVDAALVRLPIDDADLHVIRLYDELPVVVVSVDSSLTAGDELDPGDLAGETLLVPADDVLGVEIPDAAPARFAPPSTTEEAIATVAAGVGVVVVPMSLARLHHRKDVTFRVLRGAPSSTVALAWVAERTTPLVETFVGIVRGRTGNSSR